MKNFSKNFVVYLLDAMRCKDRCIIFFKKKPLKIFGRKEKKQ